MKFTIVEKDCFQVVGIKRELSLSENLIAIPKFWEEVNRDGTSEKLFKLNNGTIKGVVGVCTEASNPEAKQAMDYWIATEYDGQRQLPKGMESLSILASKWVVFEVHGPMPDAIQTAWKQIDSEWFPTSGYEHAGTSTLEVYLEGNPYSQDYYSEIWIPVK